MTTEDETKKKASNGDSENTSPGASTEETKVADDVETAELPDKSESAKQPETAEQPKPPEPTEQPESKSEESTPSQVNPEEEPPPETPAPDFQSVVNDFHALNQQILDRITALSRDFETKIKYDLSKEKIIDRLHSDLQEQKKDFSFIILQPVLNDLIMLKDDLQKVEKHHRELPEEEQNFKSILKLFSTFQKDVEHILYRLGYESYTSEGEKFDAKRHRIMKKITVSEEEQDGLIVESLGTGFISEKRLLRPELVCVCKYDSSSKAAEEENQEAEGDQDKEKGKR